MTRVRNFDGVVSSRLLAKTTEALLAGAALAQQQLEKMNLADNTICTFCSANVEETQQDLFWECSAWDFIRRATVGRFGPLWQRRGRPDAVRWHHHDASWVLEEWQRLCSLEQQVLSRTPWDVACVEVLQDERGMFGLDRWQRYTCWYPRAEPQRRWHLFIVV